MEMAERMQEVDDRARSNTKRLDRCEERLDEQGKLLNALSVIQTEQKHMRGDLDEIKTDVKALTGKSGKLWDETTKALVIAVLTAVVAFILGRIL